MKYLKANLTKYAQNVNAENDKILMRETKRNLQKDRYNYAHGLENPLLLGYQFSNWSIHSVQSQSKSKHEIFGRNWQDISKIYIEQQRN